MICRLNHLCLCVAFVLVLVPSLLRGDDAGKKNPPPDPAALKDASKLVNDAYKDHLAAAKTHEQKVGVAKKLCDAASEEKDTAGRFALLAKARDVASEAGDLGAALAAIDGMDREFTIDALKMKGDAATLAAKAALTEEDRKSLAQQLSGVIASAVVVDRYDLGRWLAEMALTNARSTNDAEVARRAATDLQQVREAEAAYGDVKKALLVLADKPTDPDANVRVGKFRCFIKGEWDKGLSLLVLGSDVTLKTLAEKEIAGVKGAEEQVKLGDGWGNVAEKLTGGAKSSVQGHAAKWYREALLVMEKGLAKTIVEQKLAKFSPATTPESPRGSPAAGGWLNLLSLVDPVRDTGYGSWKLENGSVLSNNEECLLRIPYVPPPEYDLRYSFTRNAGGADVAVILVQAQKQVALDWGNNLLGFDVVNGKRWIDEGGVAVAQHLANGHKYTLLVQVRRVGMAVALDGQEVLSLKTAGAKLVPWFVMKDPDCLALVSWRCPATFHAVEVREVTGKGKLKFPQNEKK